MSFEHPLRLWWLVGLLPVAWLMWRAHGRAERAVRLLLGRHPLPALVGQRAAGRDLRGWVVRLLVLSALVVGAAGPRWGREAVRRPSKGSDLVFVVDVSASMETRDVAPSRLDEARREAVALLGRVTGSRIGVIAFAGDAVRVCPLTLDPAAVRLTLETLTPGSVSEPGTDLGRALRTALRMLPSGRRDEQAVVLWTDGEDLEGHARPALEELRKEGVRVFVVGVGTPAGDVIPVRGAGGAVVEVKRDASGAVVRSRLDEPLLRELARTTRGAYFTASRPGGDLVRLTGAIGSLARSQRGARLVERPVERFPLFALLAAAGLAFGLATPRRRRAAATERDSDGARAAVLVVSLGAMLAAGEVRAQSAWARGDAAWRRGDFAAADSQYSRRARDRRAPVEVLANRAAARAQQAPGDTVVEAELARLGARDDRAGRMSGYNLGTLLGRRGETERALETLRRALERDPDDADTRFNYELVRRRLRDEQEQARRQRSGRQPEPESPRPEPQAGQTGPGNPPPMPQPGAGAPPPQPAPGGGRAQRMTREQAERLLGSLSDLERVERMNARRTQAQRERRGRDW